jgi:hypothetical protein
MGLGTERHDMMSQETHAAQWLGFRQPVQRTGPDDRYGDIFVDTNKSHEIDKQWMAMTRSAPGPGGLRRPTWFDRPLRPVADAYKVPGATS